MVPRVQCNRSNVPADTTLFYYQRSIGIPLTDILPQQLQNRFCADNCRPVSVIPYLIAKLGMLPTEQFQLRHDDMLTTRSLDKEVSRWFNMWSRQSTNADLPDTLMKSLVFADPDSFPKIIILLVLGCTLLAAFFKNSIVPFS